MADKQYDVSFEQQKLIEKRAKLRAALKQEFVRTSTNPYLMSAGEGGYIFDSGVQRFMSMKATPYEYFKPTLKSFCKWVGFVLLPIIGFGRLMEVQKQEFERKCRSGEITYAERKFKFT